MIKNTQMWHMWMQKNAGRSPDPFPID